MFVVVILCDVRCLYFVVWYLMIVDCCSLCVVSFLLLVVDLCCCYCEVCACLLLSLFVGCRLLFVVSLCSLVVGC